MLNVAITLVTVIFSGETNLLRLQARSIARLVQDNFIDEILLVLNDDDEEALDRDIRRYVLPEYGAFGDRVRLIRGQNLQKKHHNGWMNQQALKLEIAREVKTEWYLVLDGKNHFVRAFTPRSFYGEGLRPKQDRYLAKDNFVEARANALTVFGLDWVDQTERHMPYTTPYPLHTNTVLELINHLKSGPHKTVIRTIRQQKTVEFLLYDAFVLLKYGNYHTLYDHSRACKPCLGFWSGAPQVGSEFLALARLLDMTSVYAFGLHRKLFSQLEPSFADWVVSIWQERGLLESRDEADTFLMAPDLTDEVKARIDARDTSQPRKMTLVTVYFSGDMRLLKLQARSIARFFDADLIDQIILIENEPETPGCLKPRMTAEVLPEYGHLQDKVSLVSGIDLAKPVNGGWHRQQLLKLVVHKLVKTPVYLVLDAKNHYLRPVSESDLFAYDGRPRHFVRTYAPLARAKRGGSREFLGIDPDQESAVSLPNITPFPIYCEHAALLLEELRKRVDGPIEGLFGSGAQVTEFYLLDALLAYRLGGIHKHYALQTDYPVVFLWRAIDTEGPEFERNLAGLENPWVTLMALHRKFLQKGLPSRSRKSIAKIWKARGLLADQSEAAYFLTPEPENNAEVTPKRSGRTRFKTWFGRVFS